MDHRTLQRNRIMSAVRLDMGGGVQYNRPLKPGAASQSAPDLRASFKKPVPIVMQKSSGNLPSKAGTSKSATSISAYYGNLTRSRFTIPNFGNKKAPTLKSNDPKLPSPEEMITQVLQVTASSFYHGLKMAQLLDVVFSSYAKLSKTTTSEATLKRALENLVAKGTVSRSFGSKISDATFRLATTANTGAGAANGGTSMLNSQRRINLAVTGQKIKPVAHFVNGQHLPSGNNFQTRIARSSGTDNITSGGPFTTVGKTKMKLGTPAKAKPLAAFTSGEKCKLSKSFAFRVGEIEALKPLEYIPNSPVSRHDNCNNESTPDQDWNPCHLEEKREMPQQLDYNWDYADPMEEQNSALTERFRAYAKAIQLDDTYNYGEHLCRSRSQDLEISNFHQNPKYEEYSSKAVPGSPSMTRLDDRRSSGNDNKITLKIETKLNPSSAL